MTKVAILIDAGFFLKRFKSCFPSIDSMNAKLVAETMYNMATQHLYDNQGRRSELYRIFVYDAKPLCKKVHYKISEKALDFSKTPQTYFRLEFHNHLISKRKVALRLGELQDNNGWKLKKDSLDKIVKQLKNNASINLSDISDDDFEYDVKQKGIDMKIGTDIASLAYKKQVEQIILISGDADFIPAAKLARREGIDFIIDPMWHKVKGELLEHIDGIQSKCKNPSKL